MPGPFRAGEVTHQAVGDKPDRPPVLGYPQQEITDDRAATEAIGGRHEHVARGAERNRRAERKIVGRPVLAGQRRPDETHRCARLRLDVSIEGAAPFHGVNDEAGRCADEGIDQRSLRTFDMAANGQQWGIFDHGTSIALARAQGFTLA